MNIKQVEQRTKELEFLWNTYHNKDVCKFLINRLSTDIVFFLGQKLPQNLEERLDKFDGEINDN